MNHAIMILDGLCPTCEVDTIWTRCEGEQAFVDEFDAPEGVETRVWDGITPGEAAQGALTYRCPECGQTHQVHRNRHGDWSA